MRVFAEFRSEFISTDAFNKCNWSGVDARVARAHCASNMLASTAFRSIRSEHSTTLMTCPADSLSGRVVDDILAAGARRQRKRRLLGFMLHRDSFVQFLRDNGLECSLGVVPVVVGLGGRVVRAALAADVLAVDANFVRAKGGLAAMAGTAHSHPDRSDNTLDGRIARGPPFSRLKGQSVFRK